MNMNNQNLINLHIEKVQEIFKKKNYAFFSKGIFNLNLIVIRENDLFENTFSDTLNVIYKDATNEWQILQTPWTTLAGTLGKGGEKNPLTGIETGTGIDGVAVLCEQQIRAGFKFVDTYKGFTKYPYFDQIKEADYYRDNDRNGIITRTRQIYKGNYKTCLHRMSNNNQNSNQVNFSFASWSQGCNGSSEPDFRQLVELTRKAVASYGNIFTYTIIHRNDFFNV